MIGVGGKVYRYPLMTHMKVTSSDATIYVIDSNGPHAESGP